MGGETVEQCGSFGVQGAPRIDGHRPCRSMRGPARCSIGTDSLQERLVEGEILTRVQSQFALCRGYFIVAERGAVRFRRATRVWSRPRDGSSHADEARGRGAGCRGAKRCVNGSDVHVTVVQHVDFMNIPAVGPVTRDDVLVERECCVALNGDPIVVPYDAEVC